MKYRGKIPNKRHKIYIDSRLQRTFIIWNLAYIIVTAVLILALIIIWDRIQYKNGFLFSMPSNEEISDWALKNNFTPNDAAYWQQYIIKSKPVLFFQIAWKPVVIVTIISSFAMIFCSFVFFRTSAGIISGPINRIISVLQDKIDGKPVSPIQIRKKDYFSDLAGLINILIKNQR